MRNEKKSEFAKRLEMNSKNYSPKDLFDINAAKAIFEQLNKAFKLETLVTDRHGKVIMTYGDFSDFIVDVVNKPGTKIRVKGRTVCHVYTKLEKVESDNKETVKVLLDSYIRTLEEFSEKSYMVSEQSVYIDELEQQVEKEDYQAKYEEKNDPLTGVLNKNSFMSRMKQLSDREIVPTAAICVNINDWKFANINFGEEESDRLIVIVADIIKKTVADIEDSVIGRIDGDMFYVLLPLKEEDDASEIANSIQQACLEYKDTTLAPSVAVGYKIKTNVEEDFKDIFSDAEYLMFENKYEIKNAAGYRERLEKGLV